MLSKRTVGNFKSVVDVNVVSRASRCSFGPNAASESNLLDAIAALWGSPADALPVVVDGRDAPGRDAGP